MANIVKVKRSAVANAVPTTAALALGELAINTNDGKLFLKKSVSGVESIVDVTGSGGASSTYTRTSFTATAAQTTFTATYTVGYVAVYLNGLLLNASDYTATSGTSVVLAVAAASGDIIETVAYNVSTIMPTGMTGPSSSVANTVPIFSDTTGKVLANSNVTIVDLGGGSSQIQAASAYFSNSVTTGSILASSWQLTYDYITDSNWNARLVPALYSVGDPNKPAQTLQLHVGSQIFYMSTAVPGGTTFSTTGNLPITGTGTATAVTQANTNVYTYIPKVEFLVTTPSTSAVAGWRGPSSQFGSGGGVSGYFYGGSVMVCRFGYATGTADTNLRSFVGFRTSTTAPTDVNPSTLTNIFGIGFDSTDTNFQVIINGAGTATKIDTGVAVPVSGDRTQMYEISLSIPSGDAATSWATGGVEQIGWFIRSLHSYSFASGFVGAGTATSYPTGLLNTYGYVSAGGTSSAVGIALSSLYVDYLV